MQSVYTMGQVQPGPPGNSVIYIQFPHHKVEKISMYDHVILWYSINGVISVVYASKYSIKVSICKHIKNVVNPLIFRKVALIFSDLILYKSH